MNGSLAKHTSENAQSQGSGNRRRRTSFGPHELPQRFSAKRDAPTTAEPESVYLHRAWISTWSPSVAIQLVVYCR
jgi:hypothetical protein